MRYIGFFLSGVAATSCFATPVMARAIEFECDSKESHFSYVRIPISKPRAEVKGVILPQTLYRSPISTKSYDLATYWMPAATVELVEAVGKKGVFIRVMAIESVKGNGKEGNLAVGFGITIDGKVAAFEAVGRIAMAQRIGFSLVASEGTAVLTVAGVEKKLPFDTSGNAIADIGCGTGEFHFSDLEVSD